MQLGKFNETVVLLCRTSTFVCKHWRKNCILILAYYSHHQETSLSQKMTQTCNLVRCVFVRYDIPAMMMTGKGLQLDFH